MNKFQKATAVAVMVGGMALSGGVAHACDKGKSDDKPSGIAFAPIQIAVLGDNTQAIGNFCTVVGPVED
jgi:hypothetical protein